MTIPDHFPRRVSRTNPGPAPVPDSAATDRTAGAPAAAVAVAAPAALAVPGSRRWLLAALLLCGAAQLITISALVSADPIPASWGALLLAVAPAPLAAAAAFAPASRARPVTAAAIVVLVAGIIAQITHTGLFFVPALAAMIVAAVELWREQ